MKSLLCAALLLLTFTLSAQSPTAVAIKDEPYHHLVLENSYVRVFRVSVPAHDATLLHQHDVPYVYVALGPADIINAVAGKPEVHLTMADSQVGYSPGHFAHITRNESSAPFNNVTIELLHPQGEPENLCSQIIPGQPVPFCGITAAQRDGYWFREPQFRTSELDVDFLQLRSFILPTGTRALCKTLFVVLNDSELQVAIEGEPAKTLRGGEVWWAEVGSYQPLVNLGKNPAKYLELRFRDSCTTAKP